MVGFHSPVEHVTPTIPHGIESGCNATNSADSRAFGNPHISTLAIQPLEEGFAYNNAVATTLAEPQKYPFCKLFPAEAFIPIHTYSKPVLLRGEPCVLQCLLTLHVRLGHSCTQGKCMACNLTVPATKVTYSHASMYS